MNQHISNIKNSVLSLMNPIGIDSSDFPLIYKQIKKPFFISFPNDVYNEHTYQFYSKKHSSSNSKLNRNLNGNLNMKSNKNVNRNRNRNIKSLSGLLSPLSGYFSPLSGFEPEFNPDFWNLNDHMKSSHNCYAYALHTISKKPQSKPQPGYFVRFNSIKDDQYTCSHFYHRLKRDNPSLYLTTFDQKCSPGFSKSFLAIDPKQEDHDYHFYRQDNNGFWSHKPGLTNVTNKNASNHLITNPLTANRDYQYYKYKKPCYFFCSSKKLSHSSANRNNKNSNN
jgi:hypothetical protein